MLLVTGASGLLGRSVLGVLARRNEYQGAVRVFVRRARILPAWWKGGVVEGDLLDATAVDRAVEGCDHILHLAGVSYADSERSYRTVNVEGTRTLVEAARRHGARRFAFSSSRAIDPAGGGYCASKRDAERVIRETISDFTIVRLGELYAEGEGRGIADLIAWIRCHRWVPVIGTGDYSLAPLHVEDAAEVMIQALRNCGSGQTCTVTGPESMTYNELIDLVARALHVQCRKLYLPTWFARAGAWGAAQCYSGRVAYDQVERLVTPRLAMDADTPRLFGLTFRRFSEELPKLVSGKCSADRGKK